MNDVFWLSYVALWLVLLVLSLAFVEVLRQLGTLRRQLGPMQGAGIIPRAVDTGSPLPALTGLRATDLAPASWHEYLNTEAGLILFLTPNCVTCRTIAYELDGFANDVSDELDVMAVVVGDAEEAQKFLSKYGPSRERAVIDPDGSVASTLGVSWSPGALTIEEGRLGVAGIVNSIYQVESLVDEAVRNGKEAVGGVHQYGVQD